MELSFTLTESELRKKLKLAVSLVALRVMMAQVAATELDAEKDCDEVFDQIFKK